MVTLMASDAPVGRTTTDCTEIVGPHNHISAFAASYNSPLVLSADYGCHCALVSIKD
jgi:hypothetical protein